MYPKTRAGSQRAEWSHGNPTGRQGEAWDCRNNWTEGPGIIQAGWMGGTFHKPELAEFCYHHVCCQEDMICFTWEFDHELTFSATTLCASELWKRAHLEVWHIPQLEIHSTFYKGGLKTPAGQQTGAWRKKPSPLFKDVHMKSFYFTMFCLESPPVFASVKTSSALSSPNKPSACVASPSGTV